MDVHKSQIDATTFTQAQADSYNPASNAVLNTPAIACLVIGSLLVIVMISISILFLVHGRRKFWRDRTHRTLGTVDKVSTSSITEDGDVNV